MLFIHFLSNFFIQLSF